MEHAALISVVGFLEGSCQHITQGLYRRLHFLGISSAALASEANTGGSCLAPTKHD